MDIPFGNAFVLLLYLLPGFLAMQLFQARYPAKRVTQFETIVWSVLHSFVVHLLLLGLSTGFGWSSLDLLSRANDSQIEGQTIGALLGGGLLWGLALIGFRWSRIRFPFLPSPDPQALWPVVVGGVENEQLWVVARTKEGRQYLGWVSRYSFDPSAEDQELLLRPAFLVDDQLTVERDLSAGGVYLNSRDLEALEMIPGE